MTLARAQAIRPTYCGPAAIVAEECYLRAERARHSGTYLPTGDAGRAMALLYRRTVEHPRLRRRRLERSDYTGRELLESEVEE